MILLPGVALAAPLRIESAGCPSADELGRALSTLVPLAEIRGDAADVVTVAQLPDGYRVDVRGQSRTFVDPKRDCSERALTSAVFIAFVLEPPPVPPPRPPPPQKPPRERPRVELEIAALLSLAPDVPVVTGGGAARLSVGNRWVGGIVGISGLSPASYTVSTARAHEQRIPVDLGLRGHYERGQLGLNGDLELVVTPVVLAGATGVDVGGRAALAVQWRRWRKVAPFLGVEVVAGSRHDLLLGGANAGKTPPVWLGFSLGADVRLF